MSDTPQYTDENGEAYGTPRGAWSERRPTKRPHCHTPLRAWLDATGTSINTVAKLIGCNRQTVQLWAAGQVLPSLAYAFRLDEVTRGGVPPASWLGTEIGKATWLMVGGKL